MGRAKILQSKLDELFDNYKNDPSAFPAVTPQAKTKNKRFKKTIDARLHVPCRYSSTSKKIDRKKA